MPPWADAQLKHPTANLVSGKQLFVQVRHVPHAEPRRLRWPGRPEPRRRFPAGSGRRGQGHVDPGIGLLLDPVPEPAGRDAGELRAKSTFCLTGQHAEDVAAYVARVAAVPGQDARRAGNGGRRRSTRSRQSEQNGTLRDRRRSVRAAEVPGLERHAPRPGKVTLRMKNMSSVPHDIAIKGAGLSQVGAIVSERRSLHRDGHAEARHVHVLLLGRRPRSGGHEGHAHRQVVPGRVGFGAERFRSSSARPAATARAARRSSSARPCGGEVEQPLALLALARDLQEQPAEQPDREQALLDHHHALRRRSDRPSR